MRPWLYCQTDSNNLIQHQINIEIIYLIDFIQYIYKNVIYYTFICYNLNVIILNLSHWAGQ